MQPYTREMLQAEMVAISSIATLLLRQVVPSVEASVKPFVLLAALGWLATSSLRVTTMCAQEAATETLHASSQLVIVPTVVRDETGKTVANLHTADFQLSDNGTNEKILVEEAQKEGIALVLLMQTGGAAPLQFQNYQTLTTLLKIVTGSIAHKVALVTFDSRPLEIWNFPPRMDGLEYAFRDPDAGDSGAAIMDAVDQSIDLLQEQPPGLRRVILLLSQPKDIGSRAHAQDIVRRLGESNTTIYSVTFSPEKRMRRNDHVAAFLASSHSASQNHGAPVATPDLSVPLSVLSRMTGGTAAELARLSGGEQVLLKDTNDLQHKLASLVNDFANTYSLSFQPSDRKSGFHSLEVHVKDQKRLTVSSRSSYWSR